MVQHTPLRAHLDLPTHADPVARVATLLLAIGAIALFVIAPTPSSIAASQPVIVIATPTFAAVPGQAEKAGIQQENQPGQEQPTATPALQLLPEPGTGSQPLMAQASGNTQANGEPVPQADPPHVGIQAPAGDRLYNPDGSFTVGDSKIVYYTDSTGQIVESRLKGSDPSAPPAQEAPAVESNPLYVPPSAVEGLPTAAPAPAPSGRVPRANPNRTR